jgi:hypothetical protein
MRMNEEIPMLQNRLIYVGLFFIFYCAASSAQPAPPTNLAIRTKLSPFAGWALPTRVSITGIATESLGRWHSLSPGPNGEVYMVRTNGDVPGLYVVNSSGEMDCISCADRFGFRDGPASTAMFSPSFGYGFIMALASDHNASDLFYVPDGNNQRVRKVYKDGSGNWEVSTFAGGCTGGGCTAFSSSWTINSPCSAASPCDATTISNLDSGVSIATDYSGNVWIAPGTGKMYSYLMKITPTGCGAGTANPCLSVQSTDSRFGVGSNYGLGALDCDMDQSGNYYWTDRRNVFKFDGSSKAVTAIIQDATGSGYWDGPNGKAVLNQISYIAVKPDGSEIYVGGGDEGDLRRIKQETCSPDGTEWCVKSYQSDSSWKFGSGATSYNGAGNTNIDPNSEGVGYLVGAPRKYGINGYLYLGTGMEKYPIRRMVP